MAEKLALIRQDVAETADLGRLNALAGSHILVTGGTGFLGTWLLEFLAYFNDQAAAPCTVHILTRDVEAFQRRTPHLALRPDFVFISGDIFTFTYPDVPCDFIIHAAAPVDRTIASSEVRRIILYGTIQVLKLARQKAIKRLLYVSSGAVYDPQPPDCEGLPETDYDPTVWDYWHNAPSVYGQAKCGAEHLCSRYHDKFNLPFNIARPFTFVGPYQNLDAGFAVTDFIREGLAGKPIRINSDGTAVRSYCYGADAANWLLSILVAGQNGRVYNVGSDEPISILTLAQKVVHHLGNLGIQSEIEIVPPSTQSNATTRYVPDVSRAESELGLHRHFDLDRALSRTLAWSTAEH